MNDNCLAGFLWFQKQTCSLSVKIKLMPLELSKQETDGIIPSLQKFFREELEQDLSEMRAKFLLDYFQKEIAPYAYNKGVADAELFFRSKIEDLSSTCYEEGLTYWLRKRK